MRYPSFSPGQLGSVDADPPAACGTPKRSYRKIAEDARRHRKRNLDFMPNYDDTLQEPKVAARPAPQPALERQRRIAVGMATNIPP